MPTWQVLQAAVISRWAVENCAESAALIAASTDLIVSAKIEATAVSTPIFLKVGMVRPTLASAPQTYLLSSQ